jgi:hypothetical protein
MVHGSVLGGGWVSTFEHTGTGTRIRIFLPKIHTRSLYWIFFKKLWHWHGPGVRIEGWFLARLSLVYTWYWDWYSPALVCSWYYPRFLSGRYWNEASITSCPYQCWLVISFSNNRLSRFFLKFFGDHTLHRLSVPIS